MPRLTKPEKVLLTGYGFVRGQVGDEKEVCECGKTVGGTRQMWHVVHGEETAWTLYCVPCALEYCDRIESFEDSQPAVING